jgi:hypothetical protein
LPDSVFRIAPDAEQGPPRRSGHEPGDQLDERRSAGAILTDNRVDFPGIEFEIDCFERMGDTKALVELLGRDNQQPSELLGISFRKML